jgi:hypothetical protein
MVHSYAEPGNYTIWVEAFTGVGSVFRTVTLPVYGKLAAIYLSCFCCIMSNSLLVLEFQGSAVRVFDMLVAP